MSGGSGAAPPSALPARKKGDLDELVVQLNRAHAEVERAMQTCLEHALRAGELLAQAKAALPHGQYGQWLGANFEGSPRSARVYVRLFRERARLEDENGRALPLSLAGALEVLEDSTPSLSVEPWDMWPNADDGGKVPFDPNLDTWDLALERQAVRERDQAARAAWHEARRRRAALAPPEEADEDEEEHEEHEDEADKRPSPQREVDVEDLLAQFERQVQRMLPLLGPEPRKRFFAGFRRLLDGMEARR